MHSASTASLRLMLQLGMMMLITKTLNHMNI
jgi:hypothetical protein